jgi:hypothetical protein
LWLPLIIGFAAFVVLCVAIGVAMNEPAQPADPGPQVSSAASPWSISATIADRELIREIGYQLEELNSQGTELVGLTAFATAVATATVALSSGDHAWAWGLSVGLVAIMALFGGLAISRYRSPLRKELPLVSDIELARSLGLNPPSRDVLRGRYFEMRLLDARMNVRAIGARRRLLAIARVIVAVVVAMLVVTAVLQGHVANKSSPTATVTTKR